MTNVNIFKNIQELYEDCALKFIDLISKPGCVCLATGKTMEPLYGEVAKLFKANPFTVKADFILLDELIGISSHDERSYISFLNKKFIEPLGIKKEKFHIPDLQNKDLHLEIENYHSIINSLGNINLMLLGIGINGHIGLNEPGFNHRLDLGIVKIAEKTRELLKTSFDEKTIPTDAYTLGLPIILSSQEIWLLATGEKKSSIIQEFLKTEETIHLPASFLKKHKNLKIILDSEAAKKINH